MEEESPDFVFVQKWRERSAEFSSKSNDELSTVITRAFEIMVSALKPNSSLHTMQRLLISLQSERNLSMIYDRRLNSENNGIRTMAYGLVESLRVTILNLLIANQRIRDSTQLQAVEIPPVIHDGIVHQDLYIIPNQVARSPLPIIRIDEGDFEDTIEDNEPIAPRDSMANEGNESAENVPLVVDSLLSFAPISISINPIFQVAPVEEEEVEMEEKPVIVKRKRGRPKKVVKVKIEPKSEETNGNEGSVARPPMKKVKKEVEENEVGIRELRRVKREGTNGYHPEIQSNMGRAVPIKKEALDGFMDGNDCLVCGQRLMRRRRGYIDHHTTKHGFTMAEHHYYLLCECGATIERVTDARIHDKECDKMGYTVHRREESDGVDGEEEEE
ncbi:hypothetical protein PENTCL1PPCAC_26771 [Pristionchus entomophagus]|uniref:C2H2-type domain-containing protein n=1 Tax=Pristionchus entomophagus TaxID=358040 RepID=A0AAV5UCL8_9BILA|nr:hypothetical protein PENTCL1PPCAC_26771 [Pristionchus entomophagus]